MAQGPILVGPVQFGDFIVKEQAFSKSGSDCYSAESHLFPLVSAPGSNATTAPDRGLLGIGPYVTFRLTSSACSAVSKELALGNQHEAEG